MKIKTRDGEEFQAKLTTDHPCSSHGRAVLVIPDGEALGTFDWTLRGCKLIEASDSERTQLQELGYPV